MKTYEGYFKRGVPHVRVDIDGRKKGLRWRLDLFNHSPTGFAWGYQGSGPAQLALAILADLLDDDDRAVRLHQKYKRRVIANLPQDQAWMLTANQVRMAVAEIDRERMEAAE
jgi:hypothetical protein